MGCINIVASIKHKKQHVFCMLAVHYSINFFINNKGEVKRYQNNLLCRVEHQNQCSGIKPEGNGYLRRLMLVTSFHLEADQIIIAVSDVLRLNTALLTPSEKGVLFHSQEMKQEASVIHSSNLSLCFDGFLVAWRALMVAIHFYKRQDNHISKRIARMKNY